MLANNPKSKSPLSLLSYLTLGKFLHSVFWISLVTLVLFYATRPIADFDFWWHLKTGDVMLQQRALFKIDPFNYTGESVVHSRESVILNGYWLWQITASFLFGVGGGSGIIFLKILTAGLIAWALHHQMVRQQLSELTRITLITMGTLIIISVYNLERPQVYSILFITLLIGNIARIRMGHDPSRMLWPMMVLWANIHGGFVVGDILLGLAAAGFLIQYRHDGKRLISLLIWAFTGILASFINPNGWNAFHEVFNFMNNSLGPAFVSEYRSSWFLFSNISKMSAVFLWTIVIIHFIGLLVVSQRYWPEIFISLFIIVFGLKYIRNVGFIAVSLLPVTGWYLERTLGSFKKSFPEHARILICAVCTVLISWLTLHEWRIKKASTGFITNNFPVSMANFLKTSELSGNLFNDYGIGGFLDWSLYPRWKTFIDGRELNTRVSDHYLKIALTSMEIAERKPLYELLLDRYRIDVIAMRLSISSGQLQPLLKLLIFNPNWTPVFQDWMSFVLVRNTARNFNSIQKYGIDKSRFLDTLLQTSYNMAKEQPDSPTYSVLYNDALSVKRAFTEEIPHRQ